jgi:hypothetical protein
MKLPSQRMTELEQAISELGVIPRGRGGRYPKSIRSRIEELIVSGYSIHEIHGISGIPLVTLRSWQVKSVKNHFKRVPVVSEPRAQKVRLYLGPNTWLELDRSAITADFVRMIRSAT